MDQQLQFRIGSTFSGEGFTKLSGAVKEVNRSVKTSSAAISAVSTTLGTMDSKAAKAVAAITGLVNSFMNLNPVMIAITAATAAVSWGIKELKEREEAAQKKAEDLRKSMENLVTKLNDKIFQKATTDAAELGKEFERITKHANDITSAMNALNASQAKGGAMDLQVAKLQAVIDEVTDEGKKLAAAEWDVQIAYKNQADVTAEQTAKVAAAHQAVVDEENRVANLESQRAVLETQLQRLEQNNHELKVAEKSVREKLLKQIEEMKAKEKAVDDKILESKDKLAVLQIKEQTATSDMSNALKAASMEVTKTEAAQKNLTKSIDDAKWAEEMRRDSAARAAEQEDELRREEEERAKTMKESADAEAELKKSSENLKKAQEKLAQAMYAYETNFAQNQIWESIAGGSGSKNVSGIWQQLNNTNDSQRIQQGAAVIAGERALASGSVRTVEALRKVENQAMRDTREQMSSQENAQIMQEAARAARLRGMSEKALSQADRDWLAKYDQIEQANNKQKDEVWKQKVLADAEKFARQMAYDNIAKIRRKMDGLGLK